MKKYLTLMAAGLLLAACNSDDILEDTPTPAPQPSESTIQVPVRITADGGGSTASKARKVAGTDTGSELTFVWESTDGIDVFAGAQGMTRTVFSSPATGVGTRSAEFSGTLNYNAADNGDLALTDDTPLYSYITNGNVTYNASDRTVTMDLSEQTGTLNDALAHTLFWAESTYNGGDIHFTYQNQMTVMKFNIANVGGLSGTGTVTFMAEEGMPNSVTCSAKTGAVTPGTGKQVKATAVTFANGEATVYLAIVPNAAQAITKAEVRIDLNDHVYYQKFKNQSIPAGTLEGGYLYPQNVKKAQELKVGDVLYKDGTWSTPAEAISHPKSEVLGIVGDVHPTDEDIEQGYRHGYAIYYEDLPDGKDYDWASQHLHNGVAPYASYVKTRFGIDYPTTQIKPKNAGQDVIVAALLAEPSGLKLSQMLYPLRTSVGSNIAYPAAYYAYDEWGDKTEEERNSGTHSFLPTAGEWYRVLVNMGILDVSQTFTNETGNLSIGVETFNWANQNYDAQMNTILTITCSDGAYAMNLNTTSSKEYYWAVSEEDASEAWSCYLKNGEVKFNAQQKTDKKMIRPFVAF